MSASLFSKETQDTSHTIWVYLKSTSDIEKLKKDISKVATIKHVSGRFILLDNVNSEKNIKFLKTLPYVTSAGIDEKINFKSDLTSPCQDYLTSPQVEVDDILKLANASKLKYACNLVTMCDDDELAYNWHQLYTDSDLMLKELKKDLPTNLNSHVVVLDTGFESYMSLTLEKPTYEGHPLGSSSSAVQLDSIGHGTAVASIIGSKKYKADLPPLGISPDSSLHLYRYKNGSSNGNVSYSSSLAILKDACEKNKDPSGIVFLNLSASTTGDENGKRPMELYYSDFLKDLESSGCILVSSAGNDSIKRNNTFDNEEDNLIRVGGINSSGKASTTKGEIQAPGAEIGVLGSGEMLTAEKTCKKGIELGGTTARIPTITSSGSSFSAPIVTAILSNVQLALKKYKKYSSLGKKEQIRLLNQIIFSSQLANSINGLKALKIAEAWGKSDFKNAPGKSALITLFDRENEKFCSNDMLSCDNSPTCDDKLECISSVREKMTLCSFTNSDVPKKKINALKLKLEALNIYSASLNDRIYLGPKLDLLSFANLDETKTQTKLKISDGPNVVPVSESKLNGADSIKSGVWLYDFGVTNTGEILSKYTGKLYKISIKDSQLIMDDENTNFLCNNQKTICQNTSKCGQDSYSLLDEKTLQYTNSCGSFHYFKFSSASN